MDSYLACSEVLETSALCQYSIRDFLFEFKIFCDSKVHFVSKWK